MVKNITIIRRGYKFQLNGIPYYPVLIQFSYFFGLIKYEKTYNPTVAQLYRIFPDYCDEKGETADTDLCRNIHNLMLVEKLKEQLN